MIVLAENDSRDCEDETIISNLNLHSSVEECECCICLEKLTHSNHEPEPKPLVILACGHELHEHCLCTYIRHNTINGVRTNKCPLCKKLISLNTQTFYEVQLINKKGISFFVFGIFFLVQVIQLSTIFISTPSQPD